MPNPPAPALYFLIFILSGFCGLVYESIWSHYLKLFLGHAAYAQTLVLAIFMGGMALGAAACSRWSARWSNLILAYALVEAAIGVLALLFHDVFDAFLFSSYESIMPALGNPVMVMGYKWLTSALIILPQSILLGMTFPLLSSGLIRRFPGKPGALVALLYFANSIGAAAGVLISGFVLLQAVGLPGTIKIAGMLNMLVALLVWSLVRKQAPEPVFPVAPATPQATRSRSWYRFFLGVALGTGAASFMYEIAWIRMLSLVLGASTHAFELMLSAFILGLALGGLWLHKRIDHIARPMRALALIQGLMAVTAMCTLPFYDLTFEFMAWIVAVLEKTPGGYLQFNLLTHAIALSIMLPATFFAGMTLPLITHILIQQGHGEKSVGAVYGANTFGAIVGVFFATHWALPMLGLKGLLLSGAGLDMALALIIVGIVLRREAPKRIYALAALGMSILIAIGLVSELNPYKAASGVYRNGHLLTADDAQILFHRDGKAASIDLIRNRRSGDITISTNGKPDATINMSGIGPASPDEATMVLAGAIPLALRPGATHAGVIGMGSGLSTQTLLLSGTLSTVDTVEIEPAMVEAANGFRPRVDLAYTSPDSHIHIDDAKTYFSTYAKRYDIIVSEPSNPWVSGTASLFTNEFYRMIRTHLNSGGLLVQWLQLYEIDMPLVATVAKALAAQFVDYRIYATDDEDIVFVASNAPIPDTLSMNALSNAGMQRELWNVGVRHEQDLALHEIGDRRSLEALFASYPLPANSDYYPVLDLNATRTRFLRKHAGDLVQLRGAAIPALRLLSHRLDAASVTQITPNAYLKSSDRVFAATLVRDFLLSGRVDRQYSRINAALRMATEHVASALVNCTAGTLPNIDELVTLANAIAPFLMTRELAFIWQRLSNSPCRDQQTPEMQVWLELLRAVALGDAPRLIVNGTALLKTPELPTTELRQYVLDATMLGYVLAGDHAQATALWRQYGSEDLAQLPLASRLIVAHSLYGGTATTSRHP